MARRSTKKAKNVAATRATDAEMQAAFDDSDPDSEEVSVQATAPEPVAPEAAPEPVIETDDQKKAREDREIVERALHYYGYTPDQLDPDQPSTSGGGARIVPAGVRLFLKGGAIRMFKPSMDKDGQRYLRAQNA